MSLVSPGGDVDAFEINLMADRTIDKPVGRILASATQSFANNTITSATWGLEDDDTHSMHDNVTNPTRITIPAGYAGRWQFDATLIFGARTDYQVVDCWWRKNGTTTIPPGGRRSNTNGQVSSFQAVHARCQVFLDPALGDYMELMGVQTNIGLAAQVTALSGQHISVAEWQFLRR